MILRCTSRLLDLLETPVLTLEDAPASDEDWYANLIWLERRKNLLLVALASLTEADGVPELANALRYGVAQRETPIASSFFHELGDGLPAATRGEDWRYI